MLETPAKSTPVEPASIAFDPRDGLLAGHTHRYEKRLAELDGLYDDDSAYRSLLERSADSPVYWVEYSRIEDGPGGLVTGISVLEPGRVGNEFYMTRGHLHARADRAEMYYTLAGRGVLLLESLDGENRAIPMLPGHAVQVPGHWLHRSVNVGTDRLVTLFCYATDAGQDYEIILRAYGMRQLVVVEKDGWTTRPNPRHQGYRGLTRTA